jgi:hypothetical protein
MQLIRVFKRLIGGRLLADDHVVVGWAGSLGHRMIQLGLFGLDNSFYRFEGTVEEMERMADRIKESAARVRHIDSLCVQAPAQIEDEAY